MSSRDTGGRVTIAEMIQRRKDDYGESLADIAKRAGLSKAYIGVLSQRPTMPRADTITALARGLVTTERAIKDAVMTSFDLVTTDLDISDPNIEGLVASARELSPTELGVVRSVIDGLLSQRR